VSLQSPLPVLYQHTHPVDRPLPLAIDHGHAYFLIFSTIVQRYAPYATCATDLRTGLRRRVLYAHVLAQRGQWRDARVNRYYKSPSRGDRV